MSIPSNRWGTLTDDPLEAVMKKLDIRSLGMFVSSCRDTARLRQMPMVMGIQLSAMKAQLAATKAQLAFTKEKLASTTAQLARSESHLHEQLNSLQDAVNSQGNIDDDFVRCVECSLWGPVDPEHDVHQRGICDRCLDCYNPESECTCPDEEFEYMGPDVECLCRRCAGNMAEM